MSYYILMVGKNHGICFKMLSYNDFFDGEHPYHIHYIILYLPSANQTWQLKIIYKWCSHREIIELNVRFPSKPYLITRWYFFRDSSSE